MSFFHSVLNKRGSVAVYASMFFMALLILCYALIEESIEKGNSGKINAICQVVGNSVLSEYDINLLKRYNLFGFYGYESQVTNTVKYYLNPSLKSNKRLKFKGLKVELAPYSLGNVSVFKESIIKSAKWPMNNRKNNGDVIEREINNQRIIKGLPSKGSTGGVSVFDLIGQLSNGITLDKITVGAKDKFYINKYINGYFNSHTSSDINPGSYLSYEKEYILCGKFSDSKNLSSFKRKYIAVRNGINLSYLYSSKEKRSITMAMAEVITPGPGAIITQGILMETWALLEANNDWKLILDGEKVPILKNNDSWALDESVLEDEDYDGYINPDNKTGLDYDDTLSLFIAAMNEDIKLLRLMDLIQINMRYNYYEDFLIKEYNTGLSFQLDINGKNYEITKEY